MEQVRLLLQCLDDRLFHVTSIGNTKTNTPPLSCSPLPAPSHPLMKFSQHLRYIYSHPIPMHRKWPPVPTMSFISLATVNKEGPMSRSEVNKRAMFASQGRINAIPSNDGPLGLDDVLKSDDNEFLRCVLVEGAPGIGKSTFAWELCHQWDQIPDLKKYDLILLVSLKEVAVQKPSTWKDLILFKHPSVEAVKNHIESNYGADVLWILDGFDELSPNDREIGSLYMDLINGIVLPASTVIVTCRSSLAGSLTTSARMDRHLELLGFTPEKITEYVKTYFSKTEGMCESFFRCYNFQNNVKLRRLMYIPLNAAIVCLLHEESHGAASFQTMTDLYNRLICTLIKRHLSIKKQIPEVFCDVKMYLPSEFRKQFQYLLKLSFDGSFHQEFVFPCDESFDHLGLMNSITSSRVSLYGSEYSYYFLHSSLQEYLAALYCATNSDVHIEAQKLTASSFTFFAGIVAKSQPKLIPLALEVIEQRLCNTESKLNTLFLQWSHVLLECFHEYPAVVESIHSDLPIELTPLSPDFYFSLAGSMLSLCPIQLYLNIATASQLQNIAKPFFKNSDALGRIYHLEIIGSYDVVDLQQILSCGVVSTLYITIRHKSEFQDIFAGLKSVENLHTLYLRSYNYTIQYPVFNILDKIIHLSKLIIQMCKVEIDETSLDTLEKVLKERSLKLICLSPACDSPATLNRFLRLMFGSSSLCEAVFLFGVNFQKCSDEVISLLQCNTNMYFLALNCCRITKRLADAMLNNSSLRLISIRDHDYHVPALDPLPTDNSEVPGLIELVKTCSPPLTHIVMCRVFTPEESIEIILGALCNKTLSAFQVYDVTLKQFTNAYKTDDSSDEQENIDMSKIITTTVDKLFDDNKSNFSYDAYLAGTMHPEKLSEQIKRLQTFLNPDFSLRNSVN